jgi:hypothetical protein
MENLIVSRQKLAHDIEHLSNTHIMELQKFVQYLKFKQASTVASSCEIRAIQPEDDPILFAFGIVDVQPFSEKIDETLYGEL